MNNHLTEKISDWCATKNGFIRLPLWAWFVYIFVRHLKDPQYGSLLAPFNLAIHELGHLIFFPFGFFVNIAGGTITQLLAPVLGMWNFYKQNDFFAIALCFGWLSTNFYHVAGYVDDARSQSLDLVSLSTGKITHDWNYMLSVLNLLEYDHVIASFLRFWAAATMILCLGLGLWMILLMFKKYFIFK